jgi:hypothetical protein
LQNYFFFCPVTYAHTVSKQALGISFAQGGGSTFSPNPDSGVGFCREKILRSIGSASTVVFQSKLAEKDLSSIWT